MKLLFYIPTLIPVFIIRLFISFLVNVGLFNHTTGFRVTKTNLGLCYKNLSKDELNTLTKKSYIETLISGIRNHFRLGAGQFIISGRRYLPQLKIIFLISRNVLTHGNGLAM
jgi:hypothetical protein